MEDPPLSDEMRRIRDLLREQPLGMNIKEISRVIGMSRNSVAKYLDVLTATGYLDIRQIGNAKMYYASKRMPVKKLLGATTQFILMVDRDLRIAQVSDSFARFAGTEPALLRGCRLSRMPVMLFTGQDEAEIQSLVEQGLSAQKELKVPGPGTPAFFSAVFRPTLLEDNLPGLLITLDDITARKEAEMVARESERYAYSIIQGSPVPEFVINRSHKVIFWNRALEIMSGIRAEEIVGTNQHWRAFYSSQRPCLADLIVDSNLDRLDELYPGKWKKTFLVDTAYEYTGFFPYLGPGGRWLRITAAPIRDSQGNLTGAIETLEDVSEAKAKEFIIEKT
jgi:PAS domain-containing protein